MTEMKKQKLQWERIYANANNMNWERGEKAESTYRER